MFFFVLVFFSGHSSCQVVFVIFSDSVFVFMIAFFWAKIIVLCWSRPLNAREQTLNCLDNDGSHEEHSFVLTQAVEFSILNVNLDHPPLCWDGNQKTDFEAMAQDVSKVGKEASVWNRFHFRNSLQGKTTVSNLVTSHSLRPSQRAECPAGWPQKGGKKSLDLRDPKGWRKNI